jgi:hypothetical protein
VVPSVVPPLALGGSLVPPPLSTCLGMDRPGSSTGPESRPQTAREVRATNTRARGKHSCKRAPLHEGEGAGLSPDLRPDPSSAMVA